MRLIDRNCIECSQDQWDIYKLDPSYNCCVRAAPNLSTIIRVELPPADSEAPSMPSKKRHTSPLERDIPLLSPHPKERATEHVLSPNISSDEQDEADVERMIVDGDERPNMRRSRFRAKRYKEKVEQDRRERRERTKCRVEKLNENQFNFYPPVSPAPPSNAGEKRKGKSYMSTLEYTLIDIYVYCPVSELFESLREQQEDPHYKGYTESGSSHTTGLSEHPKPSKQSRTISPDYHKLNLKIRHRERERLKIQRLREDLHDRRQHMEKQFMEEVYSEARAYFDSLNSMQLRKK